MDSYIVRVYRQGRNKPDEISGLVENVGNSERSSFQTLRGLMTIIRQLIGGEGRAATGGTSREPDGKRETATDQ
ncbi:MAG: hypothetical protein PVJ66_07835 [Gammaproteobacteria bacterium]|jgi:hypothetical protein